MNKRKASKVEIIQTEHHVNGLRVGNEVEVKETFKGESEPPFIKLYLDHILKLNELPAGNNKVLMALLTTMSYGNEIFLNKYRKEKLSKDLGITLGTMNNAIQSLTKKQILKRLARGTYMANPHLFGKGKWKDILEIRLEVKYSPDGAYIKAEMKTEVTENEMH